MSRALVIAALLTASFLAASAQEKSTTFYKNVVPILQNHCQVCHRTGEIAPMSLVTYADVKPWVAAMKTAVQSKQIPPWFADPRYGKFSNDPSLSNAEIATIVKW